MNLNQLKTLDLCEITLAEMLEIKENEEVSQIEQVTTKFDLIVTYVRIKLMDKSVLYVKVKCDVKLYEIAMLHSTYVKPHKIDEILKNEHVEYIEYGKLLSENCLDVKYDVVLDIGLIIHLYVSYDNKWGEGEIAC